MPLSMRTDAALPVAVQPAPKSKWLAPGGSPYAVSTPTSGRKFFDASSA